MTKAERIMAILEYELDMELKCYHRQLEAIRNTHNPIKKMKLKKGLQMFEHHVAALKYAIIHINQDIKD